MEKKSKSQKSKNISNPFIEEPNHNPEKYLASDEASMRSSILGITFIVLLAINVVVLLFYIRVNSSISALKKSPQFQELMFMELEREEKYNNYIGMYDSYCNKLIPLIDKLPDSYTQESDIEEFKNMQTRILNYADDEYKRMLRNTINFNDPKNYESNSSVSKFFFHELEAVYKRIHEQEIPRSIFRVEEIPLLPTIDNRVYFYNESLESWKGIFSKPFSVPESDNVNLCKVSGRVIFTRGDIINFNMYNPISGYIKAVNGSEISILENSYVDLDLVFVIKGDKVSDQERVFILLASSSKKIEYAEIINFTVKCFIFN